MVCFEGKKRKKILFLTFYFTPDLCAGSFRSTALVEQLRKLNVDIHVITTKPNRYASYKLDAPSQERDANILIDRIDVGKHESGIVDQALAFTKFYFATKKIVKNHEYDLIFSTSSRLFTGYLGATISKQKNVDLYLDIRDLFCESIRNIFVSPFFFLFAL